MALRVLSVVLPALVIFTVAVNSAKRGTWTARNNGTTRILDGKPARVGQFPHQASIYAEQKKGSTTRVCSGSLISERAVLTSVWCVKGMEKWTVRLGGIHRTQHEETGWTTVSTWALMHPDFKDYDSDVALIYLVEKPPLSQYIKPVRLASSDEANSHYMLQDGLIAGWGHTELTGSEYQENLQFTQVTIVPNEICRSMLDIKFDSETVLCAGKENPGGFDGDDGAALLLDTIYGYKQIGILIQYRPSHGLSKTRPALYTKVASFIDWIILKASVSDY